jgi:hypothetical protein
METLLEDKKKLNFELWSREMRITRIHDIRTQERFLEQIMSRLS